MKTEETNKLIAEFLGWKNHFKSGGLAKVYIGDKSYIQDWECFNVEKQKLITPIEMKFHADWNWLMEVVEKIESLGVNIWVVKNKVKITIIGELAQKLNNSLYDTEFEGYDFEYYTKETKIEAVYNACVTFIEWYNEQTAEEKLK